MQKISPCLWFDDNAEDAVKFYTSIFKDARIGNVIKYGKEGYDIHKKKEGSVMTIDFEIEGQRFLALNGGPIFRFNEAISFQIYCDTQEEIDYYWDKLAEGGDKNAQVCGWLKDKFGLSWQVIPVALIKMLEDKDSSKTERVMKVMLQMRKLDIDALTRAYQEV
ncbi:MAG TPA: VOC family protein [Nitrososphaeraceae archaeon]|jgi:predicted 3-demethylubiquinone-9 3-methyltransferase (glyoxalase superfamily)